MTRQLYLDDAHMQTAPAEVLAVDGQSVALDAAIFYPQGGGQPGDKGWISWDGMTAEVIDTRKGVDGIVWLQLGAGPVPQIGAQITQRLDWALRHRHMRVHTALHLLSVVIPLPVTGGQIGPQKGRLDFDMPDAPEDKAALEAALNALIAQDLLVWQDWISDAELAARPEMVKTMKVKPPMGQGRVRLVGIGPRDAPVDLQPCGGTHVARTAEIGAVRLGKIEKKGRQNRRVSLHLAE